MPLTVAQKSSRRTDLSLFLFESARATRFSQTVLDVYDPLIPSYDDSNVNFKMCVAPGFVCSNGQNCAHKM